MQRGGLPGVLLMLLHWIATCPDLHHGRDYDFVEFFSGQGEQWKAWERAGLHSAGFDMVQEPHLQNVMTSIGFASALQWACR
eukprot:9793324-Alexandrium_andersonii.AAC.1